ncbi:MAG: hypothetical protein WC538_15395 [Thermoanaerobaculia bacterium]|jgi:hypothetical protein
MRIRTLLVVFAILAFSGAAQAQVAVSAQTVEKKQYSSPVVLDVNFNLAHKSLWGQGRVSPKQSLDAFVCEGIYVDDFGMEGKGKGKGDNEALDATIFFTLNAENGTPKRKVHVSMQLFDGETAISGVVKGDTIKLKDNDKSKQKLKISVPFSKLKTDPMTTLKLTLTVDK